MFEDFEPELVFQADDSIEEYSVEPPETDVITPIVERFCSWLETIDN